MAWKTRVIKAVKLGFELLQWKEVLLLASTCVATHNIHTASGTDIAMSSMKFDRTCLTIKPQISYVTVN
jgi:hypothetical protein